MADDLDLLKGTLDLLVLKTLTWGPRHGFAIARWIRDTTDGTLLVEDGALYAALYRIEERGWIAAEWGTTENNRRARFYRLTGDGRKALRAQAATWGRYTEAVGKVLEAEAQ